MHCRSETQRKQCMSRDEVVETILMPDYSSTTILNKDTSNLILKLSNSSADCITKIFNFYHVDNGFHNFEQDSHVIMSTVKLLQRIASLYVKKKDCNTEQDDFNYTLFGISSDPLTPVCMQSSSRL